MFDSTTVPDSFGGLNANSIGHSPFLSTAFFNRIVGAAEPLQQPSAIAASVAQLASEADMGVLSGTYVYYDSVSNSNPSNIYKFDIAAPDFSVTNVNITLSGLSNDADIKLIHDANSNGILDSSDDVLTGSYNVGNAAELIDDTLVNGTYFIQVDQYFGDTDYHLSASTGDWLNYNLEDAGVIGETRALIADGELSRSDVIAMLQETEDGEVIDAAELTDLRQVLTTFDEVVPDYVSNLAGKVLNGDPANPRSGIGNLFAGSTDEQMEQLIGKWFFGSDRPRAEGVYQYANGSLFQDGLSITDIDQGSLGDCYFLSSLGAFALDRPSVIEDMFIDNSDGTFTVRFFKDGVADYVTVDRYLPTDPVTGRFIYANRDYGSTVDDPSNELWVQLAEKAYAQLNESGWLGQEIPGNAYEDIEGGWMAPVMEQITGQSAVAGAANTMTRQQLIDLVNADTPITAGFVSGGGFGVVDQHAYTITSYDAVTGRFHLNNPWGDNHADATWRELNLLNAQIHWSNA